MKQVDRNLKVIYAISFVDLFAVGLTYPLLYPHVRSLGASHTLIGLLGSLYSGIQVFSGPFFGSWSDVRGTKSVLIISILSSGVCYFLLGVTHSIYFIAFLRILLGCVKQIQTLCKALIASHLPREQHAMAYGQSNALGSIGFILGPAIGGHISELRNGFFYVCTLTSLLFIINVGLGLMLPNAPENANENANENHHKPHRLFSVKQEVVKAAQTLRSIDWKTYGDAFTIRFLFALAVSIYFSNQSLYLQEKYYLSQKHIGYILSFYNIVGTTSGLLIGYLTKTFYQNDNDCNKRLLHFFSVITVCYALLYFAPNIGTYIFILIPQGISSMIIRIVTMEFILSKPHTNKKGTISGALGSVMSIARFISPITSGIIGDVFGESAVMLSAVAPSLLATIICFKLNYSSVKSVKKKI